MTNKTEASSTPDPKNIYVICSAPHVQQTLKAVYKAFINILMLFMLIGASNSKAQTGLYSSGSLQPIRQRIEKFIDQQSGFKYVYQVAISPDGKSVLWNIAGPKTGTRAIYLASLKHVDKPIRITGASQDEWSNETDPVWSADGQHIAFLSDAKEHGQAQVYVVKVNADVPGAAQVKTKFTGYVSEPNWSPDGKHISVLYVTNATRAPSPVAAKSRAVGVIDSLGNQDIQRIAIVDVANGSATAFSPIGLYVYEYDWSPDSENLVYTAAIPPGDDNWYIAKLYKQPRSSANAKIIYQPSKQVALPRWSPNGKEIAFIEGLMSDQGITSGEIFTIGESGQQTPKNHTPGRKSSPAWFQWQKDGNIIFSEHASGAIAINSLNLHTDAVTRLSQTFDAIHSGNAGSSLSISASGSKPLIAVIRSSWNAVSDIWIGDLRKQTQLTNFNKTIVLPQLKVENVEWENEGLHVQGWLQYPQNYNPHITYPLLVNAHGGPAGVGKPSYATGIYAQFGYFVFFPNPRGSLGQGAAFTEANRRDWGYGDLRDILSGVDAVRKRVKIDNDRVGLFGWSYGGSTAMFAVTQTNRFRAVVAGAGAADWLSYYGQNAIDQWMKPYFGASPYDDPDAYARCSAMSYIKNVKTPTLILVGELDGESPPAQSFQFWHALKELGKTTQLVVYPDEGHSFFKKEDRVDVIVRSLQWFKTYMPENRSANERTQVPREN
jgi:dipeptidyl aminopeptidase/acylaminoacyl peptidase